MRGRKGRKEGGREKDEEGVEMEGGQRRRGRGRESEHSRRESRKGEGIEVEWEMREGG